KTHIKELNGDRPKTTSVKLETIFEDEPVCSRPNGIKIRRRRIKLFGMRWRIRISKLKVRRIISPFKVLRRLRDAYVRMMLALESKGGIVIGNQVVYPAAMPGMIIHRHHELPVHGLRA
ncbi:hypothetical protein KI387_008618, partial [Taxus chinensis]